MKTSINKITALKENFSSLNETEMDLSLELQNFEVESPFQLAKRLIEMGIDEPVETFEEFLY